MRYPQITGHDDTELSHLISRISEAVQEIEAIQEARGHGTSKSRRRMTMFPAE